MKPSGNNINNSVRKVSTTKLNSWELQNQGSNYRNQFVSENNQREKKQPLVDPNYPDKRREGLIRDSQPSEQPFTISTFPLLIKVFILNLTYLQMKKEV